MRRNIVKGDVFLIPISDSTFGMGQVVDTLPSELYLVIFESIWPASEPPTPAAVIDSTPLLSSLSLDAKLWNGDWAIIGNCTENLCTIALPMYKARIAGEMYVESYRGDGRRVATEAELSCLINRKTVAPVRLEKAIKAKHGIGDWHPLYDELLYGYAQTSSKLRN